jgi:hypothetical protein
MHLGEEAFLRGGELKSVDMSLSPVTVLEDGVFGDSLSLLMIVDRKFTHILDHLQQGVRRNEDRVVERLSQG